MKSFDVAAACLDRVPAQLHIVRKCFFERRFGPDDQ
jgi:hypothetical protein